MLNNPPEGETMSIMKRLSATLFPQVDHMVSEIENHDDVVEAAIGDNRRALAKAKARLNRLKADGRQLNQRLEQLVVAEQQWIQRAKDKAASDEDTALKCLHKRRDCQRQVASLQRTLAEQRRAEQRMEGEISTMEVRTKEIDQQRNIMRTRQSTAEAMRIFKSIEGSVHTNIDDTFEKWEQRIMEAEIGVGGLECTDSLEQEFLEAEDLDGLRAERASLRTGEEKSHDQ
jgi:phage shock protein A